MTRKDQSLQQSATMGIKCLHTNIGDPHATLVVLDVLRILGKPRIATIGLSMNQRHKQQGKDQHADRQRRARHPAGGRRLSDNCKLEQD
jgi:hypothetical protein